MKQQVFHPVSHNLAQLDIFVSGTVLFEVFFLQWAGVKHKASREQELNSLAYLYSS